MMIGVQPTLNEMTPKEAKSEITATVEDDGGLTLSWGHGLGSDSEEFPKAYRVEFQSSEGGKDNTWKFLSLTPFTIFQTWSLPTETSYIFRVTPLNRLGAPIGPGLVTSIPIKLPAQNGNRAPIFLKGLDPFMSALKGSYHTFEVKVSGGPGPTFEWFMNGQLLENENQGTETINLQITSDFGLVVKAKNDSGHSSSCSWITARSTLPTTDVTSSPSPSILMPLKDRLDLDEGLHSIQLTSQVLDPSGGATVTWFKDGVPIEQKGADMRAPGGFYALEVHESGHYEIVVRSQDGKHEVNSKCEVKFRVGEPPYFLKGLEDLKGVLGGKVILTAQVQGRSLRGIKWFKDRVILKDKGIRVRAAHHRDGHLTLLINEANAEDEGTYLCRVQNPSGHVETSCRIDVQEEPQSEDALNDSQAVEKDPSRPPTFVTRPVPLMEVTEGDPAVLTSEIQNWDEVGWLKDGMKLSNYKDHDLFEQMIKGQKVTLRIQCVRFEHTGTYTLIAKNQTGQIKALVSLQVLARGGEMKPRPFDLIPIPPPIRTPSRNHPKAGLPKFLSAPRDQLIFNEGDEIRLRACVTGFPTPTITWSLGGAEVKVKRDERMSLIEEGGPGVAGVIGLGGDESVTSTLAIKGATGLDSCGFRIVAQNRLGSMIAKGDIVVIPHWKAEAGAYSSRRPMYLNFRG